MREARLDQWLAVTSEALGVLLEDHRIAESQPDLPPGARYRLLGPGAERHGVWEWTAHARANRLDRYVGLQIEMDASEDGDALGGASSCWLMAAAANTVHFRRQLVAHETITDSEQVYDFLGRHLARAIEASVGFTPADLDGTYVHPRAMQVWRRRDTRQRFVK